MVRNVFSVLLLMSAMSFGAQGSGIYFQAHLSQGKMKGDSLVHFEGQSFGYTPGDTIRYFIENGEEHVGTYTYTPFSTYPVDFQYAVRYSFLAGYEKSFNKVLSLRGAVGYQYALMEAFLERKMLFFEDLSDDNNGWVSNVDAQIDRHWLTIPHRL